MLPGSTQFSKYEELLGVNNYLNPFQANFLFLYSLKTSKNLRFSDVFRGYREGTLA